MKNKNYLKISSFVVILSVLISLFAISSFAEEVTPFASSDTVDIPDSFYTLSPIQYSGTNFLVYPDGGFAAGSYPSSFRSILVDTSERGTNIAFYDGSNTIHVCNVLGDTLTWSTEALDYELYNLFLPSQTLNRRDLNFFDTFCILGAPPATYYLNSETVFTSIYYVYEWPMIVTTSDGEGLYLEFECTFNYTESDGKLYPTRSLVLDSDITIFTSYSGYENGWDGSVRTVMPLYFQSRAESLAFYSTFDSDTNSNGGNFTAGYLKGKDEGFENGLDYAREELKPQWEAVAKQEGIEEGRNYTASQNFGKNLLGDTLQAPFNALMNLRLFDFPNGTPFTVGTVFSTLLSLFLLIIFLRMFAGG